MIFGSMTMTMTLFFTTICSAIFVVVLNSKFVEVTSFYNERIEVDDEILKGANSFPFDSHLIICNDCDDYESIAKAFSKEPKVDVIKGGGARREVDFETISLILNTVLSSSTNDRITRSAKRLSITKDLLPSGSFPVLPSKELSSATRWPFTSYNCASNALVTASSEDMQDPNRPLIEK